MTWFVLFIYDHHGAMVRSSLTSCSVLLWVTIGQLNWFTNSQFSDDTDCLKWNLKMIIYIYISFLMIWYDIILIYYYTKYTIPYPMPIPPSALNWTEHWTLHWTHHTFWLGQFRIKDSEFRRHTLNTWTHTSLSVALVEFGLTGSLVQG